MNNKTENVSQYVLNGESDFEISDDDINVEFEHSKVIFHEADDEFAHRNVLLEADDEFAHRNVLLEAHDEFEHRNVLLEADDEIADVEPVDEEIEKFSDNETLSNKIVNDEEYHWSKRDINSFDTVFRELGTNEMLQDGTSSRGRMYST